MKLLFIVNVPEFFLSHRLPLALAAREQGYEVSVATGPGPAISAITELGFTHHCLPLHRSSMNPFSEVRSIWSIYHLLRRERPAVVHLVTIKPVLYGGLMARLAGNPGVLAAISGLGTVFIAQGWRAALVRRFAEVLYRYALAKPNTRVIFQNDDDRTAFLRLGIVPSEKTILVRGSGVDLDDYPVLPEPQGDPVVTFAARLLKDKGVLDFMTAVGILRQEGVSAQFWVVGNTDPSNPSSITDDEVEAWKREGLVEILGHRLDMANVLARSNLVVLPSYREGLPRVLLEAAACGRAVITTDVPGCRDAVEADKTGLVVPVRNPTALAAAIKALLNDSDRRMAMGERARRYVYENFRIDFVVQQHLAAYALLSRETPR